MENDIPATPSSSTICVSIPNLENSKTCTSKAAAKVVLKQVNDQFLPLYGEEFTSVLCKIPETKLQSKETCDEKKKRTRNFHRKVRIHVMLLHLIQAKIKINFNKFYEKCSPVMFWLYICKFT